MQNLALIKLGGSVVTFKDRPLTANSEAIEKIARNLQDIDVPAIIVHGGGSFGHYWSVKYDMHTKPSTYDPHGVSVVHESMVALNQLIVNSMMKHGLSPYGLPPSTVTASRQPVLAKLKALYSMAKSKVIPVTFGDVVHVDGSRYSILSGDSLMTIIARALRPSKVIFATNVDGIYSNLKAGELVREIDPRNQKASVSLETTTVGDVTGGMKRKITEAFKIAGSGMDVMMVNGLFPERIIQAADGRPTIGTLIRKRRSRS